MLQSRLGYVFQMLSGSIAIASSVCFRSCCYLLFLFDASMRVLIGRNFSVQVGRMVRHVDRFTSILIIEQRSRGLKSP